MQAAVAAAAAVSAASASENPVTPSTSSPIPEIFDFNSFQESNLLTSDGNLISDTELVNGTPMMTGTMLMTDTMGVPQVSSFDMAGLTSNTFSSAPMGFDMNSVQGPMFLPTDAAASYDMNTFSSNDLLPCNEGGLMQQAPISAAVAFSPPNAPATEAPTQRKALNAFVGYRCMFFFSPKI